MFDEARAAGADVRAGTEVLDVSAGGARVELLDRATRERRTLTSALTIVAHGRRARTDRSLGRVHPASGFVGLKQHHVPHDPGALVGTVEVFSFDGGYVGVCPVDRGRINVCAFVDAGLVRGLARGGWRAISERLSKACPPLAARLDGLTPIPEPFLAIAHVESPRCRASGGLLFVGDAAGTIAPFAGDGQAMALESARRLAELIAPTRATTGGRSSRPRGLGPEDRARLAERWEHTWRFHFGVRTLAARALEPLLFRARRTDAVLRAIGLVPGLAPALARLTRGG